MRIDIVTRMRLGFFLTMVLLVIGTRICSATLEYNLITEQGTVYDISTQIEADGFFDDHSNQLDTVFNYSCPQQVHGLREYSDRTFTSGGKISEKKTVGHEYIEKILTYDSNRSGHMTTDSRSSNKWNDAYINEDVEGKASTHLIKAGTVDTRLNGPYGEDFLTHTVKTNKGTELSHADGSSKTSFHVHKDVPNITKVWDLYYFNIYFLNDPGKYTETRDLSDRSSVDGGITDFQKEYTVTKTPLWDYLNNTSNSLNGYYSPYDYRTDHSVFGDYSI